MFKRDGHGRVRENIEHGTPSAIAQSSQAHKKPMCDMDGPILCLYHGVIVAKCCCCCCCCRLLLLLLLLLSAVSAAICCCLPLRESTPENCDVLSDLLFCCLSSCFLQLDPSDSLAGDPSKSAIALIPCRNF